MKDFIKTTPKEEKIDENKVDEFIERFNNLMKKDLFSANTVLNNIPYLYPNEFNFVKSKAFEAGYHLTATDDNYNTVTYIMKHI